MQERLVEKNIDERIIESLREIPTTIFSNNPFDSTQSIFIKGEVNKLSEKPEVYFSSKEEGVNKETSNETSNESTIITTSQVKYSLSDYYKAPHNAYLAHNLGVAYLNTGDFQNAIKYLNEAITLKPDFRAAKLNLASAFKMLNQYDKSLEIYEQLLKNNPSDKGTKINLANLYLLKNNLRLAEKYLDEVWIENGNDVDVGNKLAIINLIKRQFRTSISVLKHCINNSPSNSILYNSLGVAYALSQLNKKAIQAFKTSLNISPSYTPALLNLTAVLMKMGELKVALETVEPFSKKFDDLATQDLLAKLYLLNNEPKKSLITLKYLYSRALSLGQSNKELARIINNIGVVYHKMNDFNSAELFYKESLKIYEGESKIIFGNLIDVYFAKKEMESALKYVLYFEQRYPEDKIYLYYKAVYFIIQELIEEAITNLSLYLKYDKYFVGAYGLLCYIYSEYKSDYQSAIKILEEAVLLLPDNEGILNNLAYNYLMMDNISKAESILEKTVNIEKNIFLTATRGLFALKQGNLAHGRYLYNKAIQMSADGNLKIHIEQKKNIEVAKYYVTKGFQTQAVYLLKKVLRMKQSVYTEQAKNLLSSLGSLK